MKAHALILTATLIVSTLAGQTAWAGEPAGQTLNRNFISLARDVPGMLYESATLGDKAKIAVVVMHSDANYLEFSAGPELAKRGYRVLCANVEKSDSTMEAKMLNLKAAVAYVRAIPGVDKVILLGHSGGGTLISAYQAIAENGLASVQGPEKMVRISDAVSDLPAADGVMLLDSNWGNGPMTLFSLDPAVRKEGNGVDLDPALNLYAPENGFGKSGATYSEAFRGKYLAAQRARYLRVVKAAEDRVAAIDGGSGAYIDDEPFLVTAGNQFAFNNKLYPQDTRLLSHTKAAWPLVHADGSVTTEIVHSVRLALTKPATTRSYDGVLVTTARNFLSRVGIRVGADYRITEDGVYGIDWNSNITSPLGNIAGIHVPLLVMGMTGSWEYLASESIFNNAVNAKDKTIAFIEGAGHMFDTNKAAEKTPGQYGDTRNTLYDYVDKWLRQNGRFLKTAR